MKPSDFPEPSPTSTIPSSAPSEPLDPDDSTESMPPVSDVIRQWREGGEAPDARAEIERRKKQGGVSKDEFIDLVYEEFATLLERGADIDPRAYPNLFPTYRDSIQRVVEVHQWMCDETETLEPGDRLLHYMLMSKLGEGGVGQVFQARNLPLGGRLEVIKVTRGNYDEAGIVGALEHPHIVPVLSVTDDPKRGQTIIAMPYLGRATLGHVFAGLRDKQRQTAEDILDAAADRVLQSTRPTPLLQGDFISGATELARQICDGLCFAHQNQIVHGDIKPSNVLVTPWGQAMLLDFNLAIRSTAEDEYIAEAEDIVEDQGPKPFVGGTIPYLAPELLRSFKESLNLKDNTITNLADLADLADLAKLGTRPTQAADVYSLGVVLYELFAGEYPFGSLKLDSDEQLVELLLERQGHRLPRVDELAVQVPAEIADVIQRCLASEPDHRPRVREVEQTLRQWQLEQALAEQRERAIREENLRLAAEQKASADAARRVWKWGASLVVAMMVGVLSTLGLLYNPPKPQTTQLIADKIKIRELYLTNQVDEAIALAAGIAESGGDPEIHGVYAYLMLRRGGRSPRDYLQHYKRAQQGEFECANWCNYAFLLKRDNPQHAKQILVDCLTRSHAKPAPWQPHFLLAWIALTQARESQPVLSIADGATHMMEAMDLMPNRAMNAAQLQIAIPLLMKARMTEELKRVLNRAIANGIKLDETLSNSLRFEKVMEEPWWPELEQKFLRGANKYDRWFPVMTPRLLLNPSSASGATKTK